MTNSILFVEDPILEGDIYEGAALQRLVKLAHYERILSKTHLDFVGNSLLSDAKLSKEGKFKMPVFKIVGVEGLENEEVVSLFDFHDFHIFLDEFPYSTFLGITLTTLQNLMDIARGYQERLKEDIEYVNFNSVFFRFQDGFVVCNSHLIKRVKYFGIREI